jgi:hypothetical protein
MARQLRGELENAFNQITLKGNLLDNIFYHAADRETFLK